MDAGEEDFAESLVPFIREGVDADEPQLVMVGAALEDGTLVRLHLRLDRDA